MLFLFAILFGHCAVENKVKDDESVFYEIFGSSSQIFHKKQYAILVITPLGCYTCGEIIVDFMKNNYKKENVSFLIPVTLEKDLRLRFGVKMLKRNNIIIDQNSDVIKKGIVLENSIIVYFKNGKIEKKVILTPQNLNQELNKLKYY